MATMALLRRLGVVVLVLALGACDSPQQEEAKYLARACCMEQRWSGLHPVFSAENVGVKAPPVQGGSDFGQPTNLVPVPIN